MFRHNIVIIIEGVTAIRWRHLTFSHFFDIGVQSGRISGFWTHLRVGSRTVREYYAVSNHFRLDPLIQRGQNVVRIIGDLSPYSVFRRTEINFCIRHLSDFSSNTATTPCRILINALLWNNYVPWVCKLFNVNYLNGQWKCQKIADVYLLWFKKDYHRITLRDIEIIIEMSKVLKLKKLIEECIISW